MWQYYTLAPQGQGEQKFLKTAMPGELLLRSILLWDDGH